MSSVDFDNLQFHNAFQRVLINLATRFINMPVNQMDEALTAAIREVVELLGASRATINALSDDYSTFSPLYGWSVNGINVPDNMPVPDEGTLAPLRRGDNIHVANMDDLSENPLRRLLKELNVVALVTVPIRRHDSLFGFVAISWNRPTDIPPETTDLLRILGEIFLNALDRRQNEERLSRMTDDLEHRVQARTAELTGMNEQLQNEIRERQQAEMMLRQSEERYRIITELISDYAFTFVVERDGTLKMEWVTLDAYTRLTGYTIGSESRLYSVYHPDDIELAKSDVARVLQGEKVEREYKFVTKAGEIRWVFMRRYPVWDTAENRVVRFYGVAQDITARKRVEESLRLSEESYRVITELISDYAFLYSVMPDGSLKQEWVTADSYQRLTGFTSGENTVPFALYHPDDVEQARRDAGLVVQGNFTESEYRILTKSGDIRRVLMRRYPVWDEAHERVVRFYGVAQDITARKEAEEALRQSEERYRAITELISDYAFLYSIQPDGSLKMEWMTQDSYLRLTGFRAGETGDPFSLYHPDDIDRAHRDVDLVLQGKFTESEYRIVTKNGEVRHVYMRRYPVWTENRDRVRAFYGVAQNITARKKAEEALRQSEERYRVISELITDFAFLYRHEMDGSVTLEWVTEDSYKRVTGFSISVNTPVFRLFHPDDEPRANQDIERALRGESAEGEYRIITQAGELRWLYIRRYPMWDTAHTRIERFYGVAQDITGRKLAEEALRLSEERYRVVTDLISDYAFLYRVVDGQAMELEWITQDPYTRLTGFMPEDTAGTYRLYHPDDAAQVEADLSAVMRGETTASEYRIITKAGDMRWLALRRYPVWDTSHTHVEHFYGVAQDITARKEVEEALRQSEERYRIITGLISDFAFLYSPKSLDVFEPEWITEAPYLRLTGYRPDEVDGSFSLYHPEDESRARQDVQKALSGETVEAEYRIITRSGEVRWILMQRYPVWDKDHQKVVRFYGVAQNITERKRIEVEEREQRTLAEALRDTAQALNSTFDLHEMLMRILMNIDRVVPHDVSTVMLIESGEVYIVCARDVSPGKDTKAIHSYHWILENVPNLRRAYHTRQPVIISDTQHDPTWIVFPETAWIRSNVCIPVQQGDEIIGFLTCDSVTPNFFTSKMLNALQSFAHQIALAMTGARLYEEGKELAILEERQRLARDLHDAVTQTMFSASIIAETLPRLWESNPEQVQRGLAQLRQLTRGAVAEMRSLLLELRPEALEGMTLPRLIGQLVDGFSGQTGIVPTFVVGEDAPLPQDIKVALYRIAQEAFNNISKHARASEVNVNLTLKPVVKLIVEDNGRGFTPEQIKPGSLGLKIMRERAEQAGARLTVTSEPHQKTTIIVEWNGADA